MARLPRIDVVGIAQHLIQRGNNRQVCFGSEADMAAYAHWLQEYSYQFEVDIHAWNSGDSIPIFEMSLE